MSEVDVRVTLDLPASVDPQKVRLFYRVQDGRVVVAVRAPQQAAGPIGSPCPPPPVSLARQGAPGASHKADPGSHLPCASSTPLAPSPAATEPISTPTRYFTPQTTNSSSATPTEHNMSHYSASTTGPSRSHPRSARSAADAFAPRAPPPSAVDQADEGEWTADDDAVFLQLDSKLLQEELEQLGMGDDSGEPTFVDLLEGMVAGAAGERDEAADGYAQGAAPLAPGRFAHTQQPLSPRTSPATHKHSASFYAPSNCHSMPVYAFTHQECDDSPFASREHSPIFDVRSPASSRSSVDLYNDFSSDGSEVTTTARTSVKFAPPHYCAAANAATRQLGRSKTQANLKSSSRARPPMPPSPPPAFEAPLTITFSRHRDPRLNGGCSPSSPAPWADRRP